MTYQEIHRLRQVGLKQCMKCKMFMSERTYRQSHAKRCNAEHETEQADKQRARAAEPKQMNEAERSRGSIAQQKSKHSRAEA